MTETEARDVAGVAGFPSPGYEVVDLTLTLAEDLPCHWSTHQPFQHKTWTWFGTRRAPAASVYNRTGAPYTTKWMAIDEHTGTHFDAPSHFVPPPDSDLPGAHPAGGITADRVPVAQLMGPAAVIDVTSLDVTGLDVAGSGGETPAGTSPEIAPEVVTRWEADYGRLRPGDVVLFHTGWDRFYRRGPEGDAYLYDVVVAGRRPGWPAPAVSTMELLVERGVRCVGIDAPSMGLAHDGAAAHLSGLRAGAVFVECLTGLAAVPPRGAWFCFLPLKVENGTGAPGRAVAFRPAGR